MKLLFLCSLYPPHSKGGGEISTHLIARGLVQRGHSVTVITSAAGSERGARTRELDGVQIKEVSLPLTAKPLFERQHARRIATSLAQFIPGLAKFDVVHAHDFRSALVLYELIVAGIVPRDTATVTARDYAQICGSPNNLMADGQSCTDCARLSCIVRNQAVVEAPLLRRPFRIWQYWYNIGYRRKAFLSFASQIFISHAQQNQITGIQDLSAQTTAVIYNPVAPNYLTEKTNPSFGQTILYTGRVQHYKGVGLLLEAFRKLLTTHPDMQLRIVGDGDQKTEYEALVARWGLQYKIKFTNYIAYERLLNLYDEAAIVVAPHVWLEPFGRTVVEAMARARSVVVADTGGPAEVVTNGQTGYTFVAGDSDDLAHTMGQALAAGELRRRALQRQARAWVADNISIDRIASQYEEFYRRAVISK